MRIVLLLKKEAKFIKKEGLSMNATNTINISETAYTEFKQFLDDNNVESYNIRINLAGIGCGGPMFNIVIDEAAENDIVETVNEVKFIVDKDLVEEYQGFIILSSEENDGRGLSLRAVLQPEGGCSSCGGGCH